MSRNLGNVIFWLVILLFLPVILPALELHGLRGPVQSRLDRVLQMLLPDVFAALLIALFAWLVATVLRGLVRDLLLATGADTDAHRAGMHPSVQLSTLVCWRRQGAEPCRVSQLVDLACNSASLCGAICPRHGGSIPRRRQHISPRRVPFTDSTARASLAAVTVGRA
jgi:hypothetical protein